MSLSGTVHRCGFKTFTKPVATGDFGVYTVGMSDEQHSSRLSLAVLDLDRVADFLRESPLLVVEIHKLRAAIVGQMKLSDPDSLEVGANGGNR